MSKKQRKSKTPHCPECGSNCIGTTGKCYHCNWMPLPSKPTEEQIEENKMPSIPTAVCVPCGREYQAGPGKTGVTVECKLKNGDPYYKTQGDIHVCPGCGHKVVVGLSRKPTLPQDEQYDRWKTDVNCTE